MSINTKWCIYCILRGRCIAKGHGCLLVSNAIITFPSRLETEFTSSLERDTLVWDTVTLVSSYVICCSSACSRVKRSFSLTAFGAICFSVCLSCCLFLLKKQAYRVRYYQASWWVCRESYSTSKQFLGRWNGAKYSCRIWGKIVF